MAGPATYYDESLRQSATPGAGNAANRAEHLLDGECVRYSTGIVAEPVLRTWLVDVDVVLAQPPGPLAPPETLELGAHLLLAIEPVAVGSQRRAHRDPST
jgi:hypothetical protein